MFRENRFSHADSNARAEMDGHEERTSPSSKFHFAKLKKNLPYFYENSEHFFTHVFGTNVKSNYYSSIEH